MTQGYITVALDRQRYVDMAVNFAKSVKFFDKTRRTCLVFNDRVEITPTVRSVFDDIVQLPVDEEYVGCMNKVRIYDVAPYDENMYVDADCLLVKNDIDRHWARCAGRYFTMTGEKATSGQWNNLVIAEACEALGLPYIVRMNSGVFYFTKSPETKAFFDRVDWFYRHERNRLSNIHQNRVGQYADEPFFGAAMGALRLEPVDGGPSEGSWMVTTWRARRCHFDPLSNTSYLEKPSRLVFGLPLVPYGWVKHSPTIAHFIGLKPALAYSNAVASFDRARAMAA